MYDSIGLRSVCSMCAGLSLNVGLYCISLSMNVCSIVVNRFLGWDIIITCGGVQFYVFFTCWAVRNKVMYVFLLTCLFSNLSVYQCMYMFICLSVCVVSICLYLCHRQFGEWELRKRSVIVVGNMHYRSTQNRHLNNSNYWLINILYECESVDSQFHDLLARTLDNCIHV